MNTEQGCRQLVETGIKPKSEELFMFCGKLDIFKP